MKWLLESMNRSPAASSLPVTALAAASSTGRPATAMTRKSSSAPSGSVLNHPRMKELKVALSGELSAACRESARTKNGFPFASSAMGPRGSSAFLSFRDA
jgi:hypothetical protein